MPSSYLGPTDTIIVQPHSVIPCDCYVLEGSSLIAEGIVTGESLPVKKGTGDFLLGGARNLNSRLICAIQRAKDDSFYTKLVQNAAESSSSASGDNMLIRMITRFFVVAVLTISFAAPLISARSHLGTVPFYDLFHDWIADTITILTCACPCAISLAIPSAVVAAVGMLYEL